MTRFMRALVAVAFVAASAATPATARPVLPEDDEAVLVIGYAELPGRARCVLVGIHQVDLTGQAFEALAVGEALDPLDHVRCLVLVNGADADRTPFGLGVTAGRLTYAAGETDMVSFCVEVDGPPPGEQCAPLTRMRLSLSDVDALQDVFMEVDALVCPFLYPLWIGDFANGHYIKEGTVFVNHEPVYDCPPYEYR